MKNCFFVIFAVVLFASCKENGSDVSKVEVLNQDIYDKMSAKYYWAESMPNLDPLTQDSPSEYFYSLLNKDDKWSFISNSYVDLVQLLSGSSKEIGYSFQLYNVNGASSLVAYIEYVYPNSPADKAGLQRGDVIGRVNGKNITQDNADELYADVVSVNLATINGIHIKVSENTIPITAEVIHTNPILATNIFDAGAKKVGYLALTSFISDYDDELQKVFADFQGKGVNELILDLRYNNGGEVSSAQLLASMILPPENVGKTFVKYSYNAAVGANVNEDDAVLKLIATSQNLNLSKVYVLTTESTASAAEMIIYGLSPYIDVVQIGAKTVGKYYISSIIGIEYGWAILPLIGRVENSDNTIDYKSGLNPQYEISDDYTYPLGDYQDKLTQLVINLIEGNTISITETKSATFYKAAYQPQKNSLTNIMCVR